MMIDVEELRSIVMPEAMDKGFAKCAGSRGWTPVIANVVLGALLVLVLSLLSLMARTSIELMLRSAIEPDSAIMALGSGVAGALAGGLMLGASAVLDIVLFFLYAIALYLIAKHLGRGKASFIDQATASSKMMLAMSVFVALLKVVEMVPCLGCLSGLFLLAGSLYFAFMHYHMLMALHGIEADKALLCLAVYLIPAAMIVGLHMGVLFLLGLATILGSIAAFLPFALAGGALGS